ncbi:upstream stimulatory factor 2 isoform X2 [Misgurnus anguillicaudatus]|uniref:upstream stimulatory factor 2 isoform X2 n=1 Tax=Misgurnus anguillicaudatus TaxID=75329 RepID=UPI003CCEFE36
MDMLEHNSHTLYSQKNQEKKVAHISEVDTGNKATAGGVAAFTGVSQPSAFLDGNFPYQFQTENTGGQVTYRVIQVADGLSRGASVNVVSSSNLTRPQQAVTQTVIQNPFHNGGRHTEEESLCAYFPEAPVSEGTATAMSVQAADDPSLSQTPGQFYVMMTPSDSLHSASQRTIAPHAHAYTVKMDSLRTPRDERRRAQHNEVERRRRDKINNWIVALSKIIPDCSVESTKTSASKGGILSKACDYIGELQGRNQRLQERLRGLHGVQMDHDLLRQQLEELKSENVLLRSQLEQHGIEGIPDVPAQ